MKVIVQCSSGFRIPDAEVIAMVGSEKMRELKQKDPSPFLKAWVIAHEGVATPEIVGEGVRPVAWPRKAVRSVLASLKKGLPIFWEHAKAANDSELLKNQERPSIGEIVGFGAYEHKEKLHAVMVGYIEAEHREKAVKGTAASMEAFWNLVEDAGRYIAEGVETILSVAIGDASKWRPGFPAAHDVAAVQASVPVYCMSEEKEERRPMNLRDVQEYVRANKVHPTQLFAEEDFKQDKVYIDLLSKYKDEEKKNLSLQREIKKLSAVPLLEREAEKLKLNAIGMKILSRRKLNFDPGEDDVNKSIEKFLAEIKEEAEEYATAVKPEEGDKSSPKPPTVSNGAGDAPAKDDWTFT